MSSGTSSIQEIYKRWRTLATHRIGALPVVVLMPHSRCNCRCVMCDIWKANQNKQELTRDELARHLDDLRGLSVRKIVLSGGEALMHANLWTLCELFEEIGARVTLLTSGLLLREHAKEIVRWCSDVIVSLDGSRQFHDAIRRVPDAYDRLADGVVALKQESADYPVTARCVVQRSNYLDIQGVIDAAHEIGLDRISFLAADVSTQAFNRPVPWDKERSADVALSCDEAEEFVELIEDTLVRYEADIRSGFIAEAPEKLRALGQYFRALAGVEEFAPVTCNAPWVSAVIEANGDVRPCFFHPPYGNLHEQTAPPRRAVPTFSAIVNSEAAVQFRRQLDVHTDPVCRKCVCTLSLAPYSRV